MADSSALRTTITGSLPKPAWLADTGYAHEPARSTFLLKLYFDRPRRPAAIRERIEAFRDETQRLVRALESRIAQLGRMPAASGPSLVLSFGLAQARAMLAWCDETLARLPKGRGRSR